MIGLGGTKSPCTSVSRKVWVWPKISKKNKCTHNTHSIRAVKCMCVGGNSQWVETSRRLWFKFNILFKNHIYFILRLPQSLFHKIINVIMVWGPSYHNKWSFMMICAKLSLLNGSIYLTTLPKIYSLFSSPHTTCYLSRSDFLFAHTWEHTHTVCLLSVSWPDQNVNSVTEICLFCSLLYLQYLEPCWAYCVHPINKRMNGCLC